MTKDIPVKPTTTPKEQLADKTKAMTIGDIVQKQSDFSPLKGNFIDPKIGHKPQPKK